MAPESSLTRKQFYEQYWFSPLQMVTLINPKAEDYKFMVEMRHFIIRAGAQEQMPGTVANVYLSQMTRILAQDEDKLQFLSDYFDRLIVDVKSLMQEDNSQPAYLKQVPQSMIGEAPETPPWQNKQVEAPSAIAEPNTTMRDTLKDTDLKETEEVKEFELGGDKYKMLISKKGTRMYYKNGKMTSEAEYAKSASML